MKARDQVRLDTLRSALSAFSYKKIEAGRELEEPDQVDVVRKLIKQRTDSIVEFEGQPARSSPPRRRASGTSWRPLPAQKGPEEIRPIVRAALPALAPEGQRNQGCAMKAVMPALKGEADGGRDPPGRARRTQGTRHLTGPARNFVASGG
jgi:uncharacterized protein YqeY